MVDSCEHLNFPGKSKNKNQGLYYLYLEAVSVSNSKSPADSEDFQVTNSETRANMLSDFHAFSPRDLEFIVKFSEEHGSDIFRQILQSFCPSIYGHELVKGNILFYILKEPCCSVKMQFCKCNFLLMMVLKWSLLYCVAF